MGTFEGHAVPGTSLLIIGLWWTVNIFYRYHKARLQRAPYTASITYAFFFCTRRLNCHRLPWEGIIKILLASVATVEEIIEGNWSSVFPSNSKQHIIIFAYFVLSGIIDVLVYFRVSLPPAIDHIAMAGAFGMQLLLLIYHLHGSDLKIICHTLLIYVVAGDVIATVVEIKLRHSVLVSLARAYFIILQATWLWQISFILYDPLPGAVKWDGMKHDNIMATVMLFTMHVAVVSVAVLAIGALVNVFVVKRQHRIAKSDVGLEEDQEKQLLEY